MEKMIKHLLFTYGEQRENPLWFEGSTDQPKEIIVEGLARHGQVVDVTREYDINRGENLDAFYTDAEREAIEDGSYVGPDAEVVFSARANTTTGTSTVTSALPPATGGVQPVTPINDMSDEEIADMIQKEGLNSEQTVALAGDDPEQIEKVMDAENLLENGPRKGVIAALDKKLATVTTGDDEDDEIDDDETEG